MKLAKMMGASSFAHLLGLSAAKAEDDDKDKQRGDESDEDYAKRMEDDDGEKKEKEDDAKGEDDKDKEDANADDGDDDDDDGEKKPKSKKAEDEDKKEKAARMSERARCAAIFASTAATGRPEAAAHLAFNTDLPAADAISMMNAIGGQPSKFATRNLSSRMAELNVPNVGAGAGPAPSASSAQGIAAQIIAAGKKARGES